MIQTSNLKNLLRDAKILIDHQKEIEILKGERFNIFSILRMESRENETHSAFLCELLNPKGTHFKNSTFLKLFLQTIDNTKFDISTTKVKSEIHIGKIDNLERTGGRVDIHISDQNGNSITIENKIYARDQHDQLVRYSNLNKGKNDLYYLTLQGLEPSFESKGTLKKNEDYFILSYKEHILKWLQLCIKETVDTPILRETIRQYIILIKKLTSTMDNNLQKELITVMLNHYEEASFISENFNKVRQDIGEQIRQEIFKQLKERLTDTYHVILNKWQDSCTSITIKIKEKENSQLSFGIESFSGSGIEEGNLFIGILDSGSKKCNYAEYRNYKRQYGWWYNIKRFENYNNYKIKISNPDTLVMLYNDKSFYNGFINHVIFEIIEYLNDETKPLLQYLNENK